MPELTYRQLVQSLHELTADLARSADAIRARAKFLEDEAQDTANIAELIGAMAVDNETIVETRELAMMMRGVAESADDYASAAWNTSKLADAATTQAHASHGGINEAVNASPANGIHDVKRAWFDQQ